MPPDCAHDPCGWIPVNPGHWLGASIGCISGTSGRAREARREAVRLGLAVSGTIGILERAAENGLLNLEAAFARLTATNYRIDRRYWEALQRG